MKQDLNLSFINSETLIGAAEASGNYVYGHHIYVPISHFGYLMIFGQQFYLSYCNGGSVHNDWSCLSNVLNFDQNNSHELLVAIERCSEDEILKADLENYEYAAVIELLNDLKFSLTTDEICQIRDYINDNCPNFHSLYNQDLDIFKIEKIEEFDSGYTVSFTHNIIEIISCNHDKDSLIEALNKLDSDEFTSNSDFFDYFYYSHENEDFINDYFA